MWKGCNTAWVECYRGTSLIRKCLLLAAYSRTMPRALGMVLGGGGSFL